MIFIFLGIMAGQFLYMCTLWLQHRRREYAFYIIHYIIFVYFLVGLSAPYFFSATYILNHPIFFKLLQFQPLHIFNYYLYIKFAQYFLETQKLYPYHNKQAVLMMKGVGAGTLVCLLSWVLLDTGGKAFAAIYLAISVLLMVWAMWLVYLIYTMRTRQSAYLFRGSLLLSIGIFCTYIFIGLADAGIISPSQAIFYPALLGVLGEIYFVNAGLNYKATIKRKQLIRTQQQWIEELEKNRLLLQEREQVRDSLSLELNKEIGTTLNGISLFAEHSMTQLKMNELKEVENVLNRIVEDSGKMVSSMSDIIWVLSPDNDTMAKTLLRIQSFSKKQAAAVKMEYDFTTTVNDSISKLDMESRRLLYSVYKDYFLQFLSVVKEKVTVHLSRKDNRLEFSLRGICASGKGEKPLRLNEPVEQVLVKEDKLDAGGYRNLVFIVQTHPTG